MSSDADGDDGEKPDDSEPTITLPIEADFLYAYSTAESLCFQICANVVFFIKRTLLEFTGLFLRVVSSWVKTLVAWLSCFGMSVSLSSHSIVAYSAVTLPFFCDVTFKWLPPHF